MSGNIVKEHLVSFLRKRLAEHEMFISDESLEYTAERYARKIMMNPRLSVAELIDNDIEELEGILKYMKMRDR